MLDQKKSKKQFYRSNSGRSNEDNDPQPSAEEKNDSLTDDVNTMVLSDEEFTPSPQSSSQIDNVTSFFTNYSIGAQLYGAPKGGGIEERLVVEGVMEGRGFYQSRAK